jgi:hypothetical protein
MRLIQEEFDTEAEARAFIDGIELVNDSDMATHEPRLLGTQWTSLRSRLGCGRTHRCLPDLWRRQR